MILARQVIQDDGRAKAECPVLHSVIRRIEGMAFPCHMSELAATNHKRTSSSPLCVRVFPYNDVES
jgi:hypothetical protein